MKLNYTPNGHQDKKKKEKKGSCKKGMKKETAVLNALREKEEVVDQENISAVPVPPEGKKRSSIRTSKKSLGAVSEDSEAADDQIVKKKKRESKKPSISDGDAPKKPKSKTSKQALADKQILIDAVVEHLKQKDTIIEEKGQRWFIRSRFRRLRARRRGG
jgi:hypothetical protein